MGRCFLCDPGPGLYIPDECFREHFEDEHPGTLENVQTWPDGKVVIHDTSLEPSDFEDPS